MADRSHWPISDHRIGRDGVMQRRLGLWMAFGLSLMQALFFVGAAVLPLQTVGPPAFDRTIIRAQMWAASGQPLFFILAVTFILVVAFSGRRTIRLGQVALALGLMLAAHVALLSETRMLIRHGDLAMAHDAANTVILVTRIASTLFALVSAWLIARIVVGQLVRDA